MLAHPLTLALMCEAVGDHRENGKKGERFTQYANVAKLLETVAFRRLSAWEHADHKRDRDRFGAVAEGWESPKDANADDAIRTERLLDGLGQVAFAMGEKIRMAGNIQPGRNSEEYVRDALPNGARLELAAIRKAGGDPLSALHFLVKAEDAEEHCPINQRFLKRFGLQYVPEFTFTNERFREYFELRHIRRLIERGAMVPPGLVIDTCKRDPGLFALFLNIKPSPSDAMVAWLERQGVPMPEGRLDFDALIRTWIAQTIETVRTMAPQYASEWSLSVKSVADKLMADTFKEAGMPDLSGILHDISGDVHGKDVSTLSDFSIELAAMLGNDEYRRSAIERIRQECHGSGEDRWKYLAAISVIAHADPMAATELVFGIETIGSDIEQSAMNGAVIATVKKNPDAGFLKACEKGLVSSHASETVLLILASHAPTQQALQTAEKEFIRQDLDANEYASILSNAISADAEGPIIEMALSAFQGATVNQKALSRVLESIRRKLNKDDDWTADVARKFGYTTIESWNDLTLPFLERGWKEGWITRESLFDRIGRTFGREQDLRAFASRTALCGKEFKIVFAREWHQHLPWAIATCEAAYGAGKLDGASYGRILTQFSASGEMGYATRRAREIGQNGVLAEILSRGAKDENSARKSFELAKRLGLSEEASDEIFKKVTREGIFDVFLERFPASKNKLQALRDLKKKGAAWWDDERIVDAFLTVSSSYFLIRGFYAFFINALSRGKHAKRVFGHIKKICSKGTGPYDSVLKESLRHLAIGKPGIFLEELEELRANGRLSTEDCGSLLSLCCGYGYVRPDTAATHLMKMGYAEPKSLGKVWHEFLRDRLARAGLTCRTWTTVEIQDGASYGFYEWAADIIKPLFPEYEELYRYFERNLQ